MPNLDDVLKREREGLAAKDAEIALLKTDIAALCAAREFAVADYDKRLAAKADENRSLRLSLCTAERERDDAKVQRVKERDGYSGRLASMTAQLRKAEAALVGYEETKRELRAKTADCEHLAQRTIELRRQLASKAAA